MKAADYIARFLVSQGVSDVFGYAGGMVTHLMDSFARDPEICVHTPYHEQGAGFAACGYAQATGRVGFAFATSGPGATNLLTPLANAWCDSLPVVFVTGQVNSNEQRPDLAQRQSGFQGLDVASMAKPVSKMVISVSRDGTSVPEAMEEAFEVAQSGRKGPVLIDMAMDMTANDIGDAEPISSVPATQVFSDPSTFVKEVVDYLDRSSRPVLLLGEGVRQANMVGDVMELAKRLRIPVVLTMPAVDLAAADSKVTCFGFIGTYGDRWANMIVHKSDLLISLGARLDIRQTGAHRDEFAPNATLIRVDIDAQELACPVHDSDKAFKLDLIDALPALLGAIDGDRYDFTTWIETCSEIKACLLSIDRGPEQDVMAEIASTIPEDAIVVTDVGQNQIWAAHGLPSKPGQRVLFSAGLAAMGYALPAAIGAKIATDRPAIALMGDGGLSMNIQELAWVKREEIPLTIVVLDNHALGMIRVFQNQYFDGRHAQTSREGGYDSPDFVALARSFGISAMKVRPGHLEITDPPPSTSFGGRHGLGDIGRSEAFLRPARILPRPATRRRTRGPNPRSLRHPPRFGNPWRVPRMAMIVRTSGGDGYARD